MWRQRDGGGGNIFLSQCVGWWWQQRSLQVYYEQTVRRGRLNSLYPAVSDVRRQRVQRRRRRQRLNHSVERVARGMRHLGELVLVVQRPKYTREGDAGMRSKGSRGTLREVP